jgi:ketosteroid isomerase-like protein
VSERNLRSMLEGYASFNSGDTSWASNNVAEDVEWGTTGAFPGMEQTYRGPSGIEEWMRTVRGEWAEFEVSLLEVLRETEDALVVVERLWGRGKGSGAEAEMKVFTLYRFTAEGKVALRRAFTTADEALAAL